MFKNPNGSYKPIFMALVRRFDEMRGKKRRTLGITYHPPVATEKRKGGSTGKKKEGTTKKKNEDEGKIL